MRKKRQVYAIIRLDGELAVKRATADLVTVKSIVPSLNEAQAEVDRLNALRPDEDIMYVWQATRYFMSTDKDEMES
jgi:hypothetical protein